MLNDFIINFLESTGQLVNHDYDYVTSIRRYVRTNEFRSFRDSWSKSALDHAITDCDVKNIELLIDYGFKPNVDKWGQGQLARAVISFSDEEQLEQVIYMLCENGAEDLPDSIGNTAQHHAALRGKSRALKQLVDLNGVVSSKNKLGQTPIDIAMEKGIYDADEYLIESESSNAVLYNVFCYDNGLAFCDEGYKSFEDTIIIGNGFTSLHETE